MLFQPGQSGNPTGRKKGEVNKLNIDIRQKFYKVYDNMGKDDKLDGDMAFLVWARSHKKVFYSLFAKLAPTNLNITDSREHEGFMDRMAKEMLLKEAQVIEAKQVTLNNGDNSNSQITQLPMGNDTNIIPSNGGHMGDDTIDKELKHPIINADSKQVISSDELES